MRALRRVLSMPGWILVLALSQIAVAAIVGATIKAQLAGAMGNFALPSPDQLLITLLELTIGSTNIFTISMPLLSGAALFGAAFWLLMVGGIIRRLDQPVAPAQVAASAVRHLPAMVIVSLWHLPLRLLPLVSLGALRQLIETPILNGIVVVLMLLWLFLSTCALDLARCQIVLHDASRKSPMTAIRGFLQALQRPAISLPSIVLSTVQWLTILSLPWLAIEHSDVAGIGWWIRLVAVIALVLGLWRLSIAVGAEPFRRDRHQALSTVPATEEPLTEPSSVEQPSTDGSVLDEPVVDEPVLEEPVVDEPVVEEPALDEPPDPNRSI